VNLATVGYWRVSTDRQGREGVSLENQAAAGERWCAERGCELVETFVEDESAWTKRGARRPALGRALAFIRAQGGRVRYLLVYDLSRFARSIGDQVRLTDELRALGVELQTVTLELRDDAHGRAVAGYLGVTNQLQSDLASEKISATMLDVVRRGRSPHLAPFGYRNGRDAAGGKIIEPDPERAPLVRRAFELAAAGVGPEAIARELAALGARGRRGARLRPQDVRTMLGRRVYYGAVESKRHGLVVAGAHEALVDRELWERAQPRRASPATCAISQTERTCLTTAPHQRVHADFPLRGFVRCGACGRPLTAAATTNRHGERYGYYFCWLPGCRAERAAAARLEAAFAARLAAVALSPGMVDGVEAVLAALWRQRRDEEERQTAAAERARAELRRRRDRLVESFAIERAMDRATYDRLIERLDGEIEQSYFQPGAGGELPADLGALLAAARPLLSDPSEVWRRAAAAEKRRVQALVFPRGADLAAGQLSTPETASIFNAFRIAQVRKGEMVEQGGATSNLVRMAEWIREAAEVVRLAA